jgi:hypothetical protein
MQTYIDTINGANAKYNALWFALYASLPDTTEDALKSLSYALEEALTTDRVREAINRLMQADIIASVRGGVWL